MAKEDLIKSIYNDYIRFRDDTYDWRLSRDKCRKFYYGQQYESALSEKFEDRGWVDIVINKIRPLLRTRISLLIASKPTGKVYAVKKEDITTAIALEEFLDWHWYNSDGQIVAEDVVTASQREGIGYFVAWLDRKADYGRGELKISAETYENVFVDKAAGKKWDLSDTARIIHTVLVRPEDFVNRYPQFEGQIEDLLHPDDTIRWTGKEQHKEEKDIGLPSNLENPEFIREFDVYERFYRDVRIIHYLLTGSIEVVDDDYEPTKEERELERQGLIRFATAPVPRIRWIKCVANGEAKGEVIHEEILPINHYPIIPVMDERTGNACPLGEVDFQAGMQELLNKSASLVILNAALSSMFKMIVDAAAAGITDLEKFRRDWAAPGGVHNIPYDKATGRFPFELIRPEPINQAFWTWMEKMAQEIEYQISTFSFRMGDPSKAPETYGATLQLGEWATDILRIPLNHFEIALQRLFEIILQWAPHHYTYFKMFDILRNEEPAQQFINAPVPLPTGFTDESGQAIKAMHDITKFKAKYRIRAGSTMPSQSVAHMLLYQQLAQVHPIFLKFLIDYLPLKEKEQVKQQLDLVEQLKNQVNQQTQALKIQQGELQRMYEESIAKDKRIELTKMKAEIDKLLSSLKTEIQGRKRR